MQQHAIIRADFLSTPAQEHGQRLRWSGHRLHAEVNLGVSRELSVAEGHAIAVEARHQLMHGLPYLSNATIHVDPEDLSGEKHHGFAEHTHGNLTNHSHR